MILNNNTQDVAKYMRGIKVRVKQLGEEPDKNR